ncbi:MAG: branched chain amino acid transporter ATP-binding protein, partial [Frankiales bacterium]|nr:branched chain amino acid transporter ATP-binding protein [Frankiales bacterium]
AIQPPLWLLIFFLSILAGGNAFIGPARSALTTQVIPPNTRTLGLQFFNLSSAFTFLFYFPLMGIIFSQYGYGAVYAVGGSALLLAGLITASIGGFFDLDRRNALASAAAAQKWEIAKANGSGRLLVCDKVDVAYDGVQTLFDIDFVVDEGECVALLGTNGAGKSTLLRAIAGITEASGGAIVVSGRDITHMPPHEIARRNVVFMPGGRGVFPDLSVEENLGLATSALEDHEVADAIAEVLEIFPALTRRYDSPAGVLSGGEQQQLALAQAFLQRPKLLMIDELSLGLAPAVVGELIEVVKRINQTGVAVIVVEQSVTVALELAKRAVYMEKGRIRFDGPIPELMRRPDILRAIYVTGGVTAGGGSRRSASGPTSLLLDTSDRKVVLETHALTKSFGGITAVNDIDLPLYDGQVLGLIGPNGSGKTTLFDMISGFIPPTSGTISLRGQDITDLTPDQRARKGLVRRFQDARLFPSLTVTEAILISLESSYTSKNPLLGGAGAPGARRSERRARQRTDQLLSLLDLGGYRDTLTGELSTGLRRIVDLACVLASDPQVLLLDEPSTGVAQAEAEGLAPLLRRVQRETGCAILIIEHDINLLKAVADELAALNLGELIARGNPDDVLTDPVVLEAYLGTSEAATNRSGGVK